MGGTLERMQCFPSTLHCLQAGVAFRLKEHDVDLFVRHLIHSISLTLWPECGWPLNRLKAAEIKVRH
jgi:hypothetical protein